MEPFQNLQACSKGEELKPEMAENEGDKEKCDMSLEEEDLIQRLHRLLGERWGLISGRLPNRKPEEVERYWRMKERMIGVKQKACRPVCVKAKPSLKLAMIESIQDVEAIKINKSEKDVA